MTAEGIKRLMTLLRAMRPPIPDDDELKRQIQFYRLGLDGIPDTDVDPLMAAISQSFRMRPAPAEIRELWAKLKTTAGDELPEVMAKVRELVADFGPYGRPQIINGMRCGRTFGWPPEVFELPDAVAITIDAMGGWVDFAQTCDFTDTSFRAQFRNLYASAKGTQSGRDIKAIRDRYQNVLDSPRQSAQLENNSIGSLISGLVVAGRKIVDEHNER